MNFTRALVTLAIALAVCLGWWLFRPVPTLPVPAAAAPTPAPTPIVIQTPPPQPAQVEAPVVAPAPVQEAPTELGPIGQVVAAQASGDPRQSVDTAIPDFTRMVDSGDYVTAAETYVQIPPNVTAQQFVAGLEQNPNFPQLVQMVQDTMRATQGMTPTYNEAGDTATYNFPAPVDGQTSVRWRKIGTQWYLDSLGGGN
jgi:hypothetical protein